MIGSFIGVALCVFQPRAEAVILINEVLADPAALTGDANQDGVVSTSQDEFVELVNTGGLAVSLDGWSLSDAVQVRHLFAADALIPAYSFFVVFGGGSPQGFAHAATASSGGLGLNNAGDTVSLADDAAQLIDALAYGSEGGKDVSLTRSPDGIGSLVLHSTVSSLAFSPEATIDGNRSLPVPEPPESPPSSHPSPVPEPASWLLLGLGGLAAPWRRRRK
jgi:hypothetical protein